MTKNKARQYTQSTTRQLDLLSGNQCAHPNCSRQLLAEDHQSIIGKICHIEAASKNGPRYNPNMSDDERRSYDNLILLCDEHHTIIDNRKSEHKYPVSLLKQWKQEHEQKVFQLIASKDLLSNNPLALNKVIYALSNSFSAFSLPEITKPPNLDEKISYNGIVRYKSFIREFAVYQGRLNKVYATIENEGSTRKLAVLYGISRTYQDAKQKHSSKEASSQQADLILDEVISKNLEKVIKAPNKLHDLDQETIHFSLMVIIVDAFMRCKILEKPE